MPVRNEKIRSFIERALAQETDECILWPFGRDSDGYGIVRDGKKSLRVPAVMCDHAHGHRPPGHEVAHSCGTPGCINRKHLRWATQSENSADRVLHGTDGRGEKNPFAKLNDCDVRNIRAEYSKGDVTQRSLGDFFGISFGHIGKIVRRTAWRHAP